MPRRFKYGKTTVAAGEDRPTLADTHGHGDSHTASVNYSDQVEPPVDFNAASRSRCVRTKNRDHDRRTSPLLVPGGDREQETKMKLSGIKTRSGKTHKSRTKSKHTPKKTAATPERAIFHTGFDDYMISSQATEPSEVGWACNSPTAGVTDGGGDIADIVKKFAERDKDSNGCGSSTPPLLGLWMGSPSEETVPQRETNAAAALAGHRRNSRRRGRQSGFRYAANSSDLVQRLMTLMEEKTEPDKEEEKEEVELKTPPARPNRRSIRLSQRALEDDLGPLQSTQIGVASSQNAVTACEQSFDLFDPTQKRPTHVEAAQKIRKLAMEVRRSPRHSPCRFRESKAQGKNSPLAGPNNNLNMSCEDLWTDEELFDDSFLQATQQLFEEEGIMSPKGIKRRTSAGTPEGASAKKAGRYTFKPDSVATITTSISTATTIVSTASALTRTSSLTTSTVSAPISSHSIALNASGTRVTSTVKQAPSRPTTRSQFEFRNSATTPVPKNLLPGPPNQLPFQSYSPMPSLKNNTSAPTKFTFQPKSRGGCTTTSSSLSRPSTLPLKSTTTYQAKHQAAQPNMTSSKTVSVMKTRSSSFETSKSKPYVFNHSNATPDLKPPMSSAKATEKSINHSFFGIPAVDEAVKDTSLSDDLLASLAEPDDLLDSQAFIEESQLTPPPSSSHSPPDLKGAQAGKGKLDSNGGEAVFEDDALSEPELLALLVKAEVGATQKSAALIKKPAQPPLLKTQSNPAKSSTRSTASEKQGQRCFLAAPTQVKPGPAPVKSISIAASGKGSVTVPTKPMNQQPPPVQIQSSAAKSSTQTVVSVKRGFLGAPTCAQPDSAQVKNAPLTASGKGSHSLPTKPTNQVPLSRHPTQAGSTNKCSTTVSKVPSCAHTVFTIRAFSSNPPVSKTSGGTALRKYRSSGCIGSTQGTQGYSLTKSSSLEHSSQEVSNSLSNSQGDKPRCSMEEIERKRQEALRKRKNKLKLAKEKKV